MDSVFLCLANLETSSRDVVLTYYDNKQASLSILPDYRTAPPLR